MPIEFGRVSRGVSRHTRAFPKQAARGGHMPACETDRRSDALRHSHRILELSYLTRSRDVFYAHSVLKLDDREVSGSVMQARRYIPTVPHPSETIRLVKAFLSITCAVERERLVEYAERIAAEHNKLQIIEVAADLDEDDH